MQPFPPQLVLRKQSQLHTGTAQVSDICAPSDSCCYCFRLIQAACSIYHACICIHTLLSGPSDHQSTLLILHVLPHEPCHLTTLADAAVGSMIPTVDFARMFLIAECTSGQYLRHGYCTCAPYKFKFVPHSHIGSCFTITGIIMHTVWSLRLLHSRLGMF